MATRASAFTWVWGNASVALPSGKAAWRNNLNSTGAGAAFNTHRLGERFTFEFETNDSAWAYQIRIARNSSGPWQILSSNSGASTATIDVVQFQGPFGHVSPRLDALASTANYAILRMTGVDG